MLGYGECIKIISTDGKLLGTILGNVDIITFGIDFGRELAVFNFIL